MFISNFIYIFFIILIGDTVALENRNDTSIEKCRPGQYPSQVCVLYVKNTQLCGGSIIHARHVLTSSYCFRDSPVRKNLNKFVLAGDVTWGHVISPYSQARKIVHLIQYPGSYRVGFDLDDIAILKVNQSFVQNYLVFPIGLSTITPTIGMQCTLLGWSQPALKRKTTQLRKGKVYIQRQIKCGGNLIDNVDRIICGANSDASHTPCIVDIGGPLICNRKLAGVHTCANRDCDNNTYGSYFMNVAFYRHWILKMIEWDGVGNVPEPRSALYSISQNGTLKRLSLRFIEHIIVYLLILFLNNSTS